MGREKEKLKDVNKELQWSNTKIKATMDHTMELYQMVDMLSAERMVQDWSPLSLIPQGRSQS